MKRTIEEGFRDPHGHMELVELTPELKQRLGDVACALIDELQKRTVSPQEAYMVLHFMIDALQEHFGFEGGMVEAQSDEPDEPES